MSDHPPFDPELLGPLEALLAQGLPASIRPEMIPMLRQMDLMGEQEVDAVVQARDLIREDRTIPGPVGAPDLTLTVIRRRQGSTRTALYHTHGGGMIMGTRFTAIQPFLEWVDQFGVVLVTVEYRLAPEHPHPAPSEDCYAGLVWTHANAASLGIDADRIAVCGASAGGGLAAAMALLARDRNGPPLVAQILVCPMLDDRNETTSSHQIDGVAVWDRRSNETGWTALLGEARGTSEVSPYAAPARATDLSNLPPAFIDVGTVEVFRDEDVAYATGIWAAGGQAELHVWNGAYHGFDLLAPDARVSQASRATRTAWVARTLGFDDPVS